MAVRKTERREERLASEFIIEHYPGRRVREQLALGAPPPELVEHYGKDMAARLSRSWMEKVDRVVFPPPSLVLIEAKIWKIDDGIAKLRLYGDDVPDTPELAPYQQFPLELVLVVPWITERLKAKAERYRITVHVFCPPWIEDVVRQQHEYWTPAYRMKREEILRTRERLGVE